VNELPVNDWALAVSLVVAFACGLALSFVRRQWRRAASADRQDVPACRPAARAEPMTLGHARERRAFGYVCVARDAIARDLSSYTAEIEEWIAAHHMRLVKVVHDIEPGNRHRGPGPGLRWALERIGAGDADALITARLEHLSPTVTQLPPILSWFTSHRRTLVAIDVKLNTSTDDGRLAALTLAGVGTWERERLSERTRRGLEAARARGAGQGRAAVADVPELRARISDMREQGMTLQAIADVLNADGVATLRGGAMWRPSSVQRAAGYRRPSSRGSRVELPHSSDGPRGAG